MTVEKWMREKASMQELRNIVIGHHPNEETHRLAQDEIRRRETEEAKKEAQEREAREQKRHEELLSYKDSHKNSDGDKWYKKIVIGIIISVIAGLLLLLIKFLLGI